MEAKAPSVIVLAGPNGAGKTTSSRTVLAETLRVTTFVNADVIAQGLAGFDPDSAALEAGRIMLERLQALAAKRADFAFETTLAGRTYAGWLRALRDSGYFIQLAYFWLNSADLAVARVAQRVSQGGHNIPEKTIRQRYERSVSNFFSLYRSLTSLWQLYDNSGGPEPELIASGGGNEQETIVNADTWDKIRRSYRNG